MKDSEVYLGAISYLATNVDEFMRGGGGNSGCCSAILDAGGDERAVDNFAALFSPAKGESNGFWWAADFSEQGERVLALGFMAAIAKDEGR